MVIIAPFSPIVYPICKEKINFVLLRHEPVRLRAYCSCAAGARPGKESNMKLRFKIALCVALMLFAAASLLSVLSELGVFSPLPGP